MKLQLLKKLATNDTIKDLAMYLKIHRNFEAGW